MFIPSSVISTRGIIFDLKCPGEYDKDSKRLFLLPNGSVYKARKFKDVCQMLLTIAYNEDVMFFLYNKDTNLAAEDGYWPRQILFTPSVDIYFTFT